jgi:hypothetical protein
MTTPSQWSRRLAEIEVQLGEIEDVLDPERLPPLDDLADAIEPAPEHLLPGRMPSPDDPRDDLDLEAAGMTVAELTRRYHQEAREPLPLPRRTQ